MKLSTGKKTEIKIAKLLLSGHSCRDCEKSYLIGDYGGKSTSGCVIREGTPEKSICKYWSND